MKKLTLMAIAVIMAWPAMAQSTGPDLGGIGDFIAGVAKSARGGTVVSLDKQIYGTLYVPYPKITSKDKRIEYAVLGLGANLGSGVDGTKMKGSPLFLPLINLPTCIGFLIGKSEWVRDHFDFPSLGPIFIGAGVQPLPVPGSGGKFVIGRQAVLGATIGFGKGQ